ncbi:DUF1365 domain-containing protein [Nioella nitratireducens]|uniref:DUF1365 domain-containing protein n=1 Tax=Nioella nitratireducens TaxID=1287720 RepID=UPI0008FCE9F7|nr:DUF1365 domain-containing protein [Nioella nitratireducens]
MSQWPEHLRGKTTHARRGGIAHAFTHSVDFVLIDPDSDAGPALFARNRRGLFSVQDRHHGGPPKHGRGAEWAREVLAARGLSDARLLLLAQPAFLGRVFNPVSFWLAFRGDQLVAVISEVTNTFGDRHSYVSHKPGFAPVGPSDVLQAEKVMHVSPFQEVAGGYRFQFRVTPERIVIRILHDNGPEGVVATLSGNRQPMTTWGLLAATLRRPLGTLRTWGLIHWHALRLKLKGARYRSRPQAPTEEVS